jgi:hypothetical protein
MVLQTYRMRLFTHIHLSGLCYLVIFTRVCGVVCGLLIIHDGCSDDGIDGCDPKVLEFLRILEEYRLKCEEEGDYMEAGRANNQMVLLRKQVGAGHVCVWGVMYCTIVQILFGSKE